MKKDGGLASAYIQLILKPWGLAPYQRLFGDAKDNSSKLKEMLGITEDESMVMVILPWAIAYFVYAQCAQKKLDLT